MIYLCLIYRYSTKRATRACSYTHQPRHPDPKLCESELKEQQEGRGFVASYSRVVEPLITQDSHTTSSSNVQLESSQLPASC